MLAEATAQAVELPEIPVGCGPGRMPRMSRDLLVRMMNRNCNGRTGSRRGRKGNDSVRHAALAKRSGRAPWLSSGRTEKCDTGMHWYGPRKVGELRDLAFRWRVNQTQMGRMLGVCPRQYAYYVDGERFDRLPLIASIRLDMLKADPGEMKRARRNAKRGSRWGGTAALARVIRETGPAIWWETEWVN